MDVPPVVMTHPFFGEFPGRCLSFKGNQEVRARTLNAPYNSRGTRIPSWRQAYLNHQKAFWCWKFQVTEFRGQQVVRNSVLGGLHQESSDPATTLEHRDFHHMDLALVSIYVSAHFYVMTYVIL